MTSIAAGRRRQPPSRIPYNVDVTLLAHLVGASQRVSAASARTIKVRELAAFLTTLSPDEIETAVHYLSGDLPQGRIGIGYSALRAIASQA
ncbi:MAG: hypothetical protein WBF89_01265, partial [Steroidobacteraceae bacterium]